MPRIVILAFLSLALLQSGCTHQKTEESAVEAAAPEGPSLYKRLGGEAVLKKFADQFVNQLALNNIIMSNPNVAGALSLDQKAHKEKLATVLCQISGGPCKYAGPSVKVAHSKLKISQGEWREMTRIFIRVLQQLKVPKAERQELAGKVLKLKSQIVANASRK